MGERANDRNERPQGRSAGVRILATATDLFARFGYNGVSTRDIASAAQVNEVTVYRHYPRKHDLYIAVLESELQQMHLRGDLLAGIAEASDGATTRARTFELLNKTLMNKPEVLRLLQYSALELNEDFDPLVRRHLGQLVEVTAHYLEPWIKRDELRCANAKTVILTLIGIVISHNIVQRVFLGKGLGPERMVRPQKGLTQNGCSKPTWALQSLNGLRRKKLWSAHNTSTQPRAQSARSEYRSVDHQTLQRSEPIASLDLSATRIRKQKSGIGPECRKGHMSHRSLLTRRYNAKQIRHRLVASLLDWAAFALSGLLAFELRFDGALPAKYLHPMGVFLCIWIVAKSAAFIAFKLDRGNWQYTSAYDAAQIVLANSAGSIMGALIIFFVVGPWSVPRSVYILDWLLSCLLTLGARLAVRVIRTTPGSKRPKGVRTRTLIYGAGAAGLALLWELRQNQSLMLDVVGLIDDDPSKAHLIVQGKRVLGSGESLGEVVRRHHVKRVLIAIPSATGPQMVRILKFALDADVEFKMVPGLGDLLQGAALGKQIRDVAVEDLLGRRPVHLDQDGIRERIQGKVVMVTGAAGSIGSELCRQIARFRPRAIVGFDQAETPLFHIERELARTFPGLVFHSEIEIGRASCRERV